MFDIDATNAGDLTIATAAADNLGSYTEPEARAVLLLGAPIPLIHGYLDDVRLPAATACEAGFVFGYKSADDYWLYVLSQTSGGTKTRKVYHVVGGDKGSAVDTSSSTGSTDLDMVQQWRAIGHWTGYETTPGIPGGAVGLYSNVAGARFNVARGSLRNHPRDSGGGGRDWAFGCALSVAGGARSGGGVGIHGSGRAVSGVGACGWVWEALRCGDHRLHSVSRRFLYREQGLHSVWARWIYRNRGLRSPDERLPSLWEGSLYRKERLHSVKEGLQSVLEPFIYGDERLVCTVDRPESASARLGTPFPGAGGR